MRKRTRARHYALQILYQIDMTGDPVHTVLDRFWHEKRYSPEVCGFAAELATGVFENLEEIDTSIAERSQHWEMDRMPAIDRCILRLGAYEMLYRDDIPPKVTINEAVELANEYSTPDSGKFVNGILDKLMTISIDQETGSSTPDLSSRLTEH